MKKIVQCVPNFSEGRDLEKIEKIVNPFRGKKGVKLLDYSRDEDHNRVVVTVVGEPEALKAAMLEAMEVAIEVIDMRSHEGQHPRMGAIDVVPFIPVKNVSMTEAIELAKEVAQVAADKYKLPIFLYEKAASAPERENLAKVRKGEYEGMKDKLQQPEWKPDFGPATPHETAGVTAIGARMPLVAFNVNLDTNNLEVANKISKNVRFLSGGLRYCKAIGIELKERGIVQVSMNMTDYSKTALYRVFELIRIEAKRYGVNVVGSEIIGLLPMEALIDTAVYYLGVEDFSMEQVLETRIME
ncbi:glutamate formimidoyltransferase [Alkaliphilus pronyensis]|uniref:glutamate formimidoyltransferase n=1 Tax=Alkaliphilus pronyensis TaxID=1482732 RepID=A0A6I0FJQ4_9FIRM|nr:glutamate formimidoyltransferase [Alkaliphilus pronyensis]KAB3536331.1 glutamate formimidoyltransferase [Alkaliphilus pronyensis]